MGNLGQVLQSAIDLENKQFSIINHYGMDNQLDQLVEECAELILAIRKYKRIGFVAENSLISELGDVENLIQQIKLKNTRFAEGIEKNNSYKVRRELERIRRSNG